MISVTGRGNYYWWNNPMLARTLIVVSWLVRIVAVLIALIATFFWVIVWIAHGESWQVPAVMYAVAIALVWVDLYPIRRWSLPDADGTSAQAKSRAAYDAQHLYRGRTR